MFFISTAILWGEGGESVKSANGFVPNEKTAVAIAETVWKSIFDEKLQKPYHTKPHDMGLRPGYSLDNIQELIVRVDDIF